jgi:hypothetical protein
MFLGRGAEEASLDFRQIVPYVPNNPPSMQPALLKKWQTIGKNNIKDYNDATKDADMCLEAFKKGRPYKSLADVVIEPPPSNAEETADNEDVCFKCFQGGYLICCDGCPAAFHLYCVDPPLSEIPEGQWYCKECRPLEKEVPKKPVANTREKEREKERERERERQEVDNEREIPGYDAWRRITDIDKGLARRDYWKLCTALTDDRDKERERDPTLVLAEKVPSAKVERVRSHREEKPSRAQSKRPLVSNSSQAASGSTTTTTEEVGTVANPSVDTVGLESYLRAFSAKRPRTALFDEYGLVDHTYTSDEDVVLQPVPRYDPQFLKRVFGPPASLTPEDMEVLKVESELAQCDARALDPSLSASERGRTLCVRYDLPKFPGRFRTIKQEGVISDTLPRTFLLGILRRAGLLVEKIQRLFLWDAEENGWALLTVNRAVRIGRGTSTVVLFVRFE